MLLTSFIWTEAAKIRKYKTSITGLMYLLWQGSQKCLFGVFFSCVWHLSSYLGLLEVIHCVLTVVLTSLVLQRASQIIMYLTNYACKLSWEEDGNCFPKSSSNKNMECSIFITACQYCVCSFSSSQWSGRYLCAQQNLNTITSVSNN